MAEPYEGSSAGFESGSASGEPGSVVLRMVGAGFRFTDTDTDFDIDAAGRAATGTGAGAGSGAEASAGPDRPALSGIDLQIRTGEMLSVLGPHESGTSTLCRLAAGLLETRGRVDGEVRRCGTVAMLGDDPEAQITGMTSLVDDEVRLPSRLFGREAEPASMRQPVSPRPERPPMSPREALGLFGMTRLLGRRLDRLSGGERQMVALAGLITLRPSLLVLDQPSLSLDPHARALLLDALRDYRASGGAVLLTGHQYDELSAAADRTLFLREGRVAAECGRGGTAEVTEATLRAHGVWGVVDPGSEPRPEPAPGNPAPGNPAPGNPAPGNPAADGAAADGAAAVSAPVVRALQVSDLAVVRGETRVFRGLDLSVGAGEILAVVGANGAGKSTLLRALAGLLGRDSSVTGEAWVAPGDPEREHEDGREPRHGRENRRERRARGNRREKPMRENRCENRRENRCEQRERGCPAAAPQSAEEVALLGLPPHLRARYVAWVGQDPSAQLSATSVRAELERATPLPPHRRRDRARVRAERAEAVDELLHRTGLAAHADEHPYDLSPALRKDAVIASALLTRPAVLLLDEPTLGRDLESMLRLERMMRDYAGAGGAIVVTTHDLRWARGIADRLLSLGH